MLFVPHIIERQGAVERSMDPFSRLLQERIIFLGGEVSTDSMNLLIAQVLFLQSNDKEKPIKFYINSPGGSVHDGMGLYDTIKLSKTPVHTYCVGMAASMGAILLSAGVKGHRYILPNSMVMIHQPSGGAHGMSSDVSIAAKQLERWRARLNTILADNCGRTFAEVEKASDRDHWLEAKEAKEFGIVDVVVG